MRWLDKIFEALGRQPRTAADSAEEVDPLEIGARFRPASEDNSPRFRSTASDNLLRERGSNVEDGARLRMRRAFTPSQPVGELRMFAGRRDLLARLIEAIEDRQMHVVLYGDRGMGKTSLLHVLAGLARDARYTVRYASCSETTAFDETFRAVAADIALLYHGDRDPTAVSDEERRSFADLLDDRPLTVSAVAELLEKVAGTRVLIMLDEFDRVRSSEFRRMVAELIKTLSDRSARVQLVIAGVAGNLAELIEYIPSIRRNVLGLPVGRMPDDQIEQILALGGDSAAIGFAPDSRRAIVRIANGSPYLASLIAQHSGFAAIDRRATMVTEDDVRIALRSSIAEVEERAAPETRTAIGAIAGDDRRRHFGELAGAALRGFGFIRGEDIAGDEAKAAIAEGEALGIVEAFEMLGEKGYRFVDDGAALFLWLSANVRNAGV